MAKSRNGKKPSEEDIMKLGGILGGLGNFLEQLGALSEKGAELNKTGEFCGQESGKVRGVYGVSIRVGLGDEGVTVEPFGNVRRDEKTGATVVDEIREPMVDLFEEADHLLVIAEMPGISDEDVKLNVKDDILTIDAAGSKKKYRKEVLLPAVFPSEKMSHSCRNGLLEIKLRK